jgi:GT2 family glycosyltransferase
MYVSEELLWELIVIDNNSKDNTKCVVEELKKSAELNVRYVFEEKQGLSYARNRGIKEAKEEIIAFTDDDVIVDKNWVNNIIKVFNENDVSCIGGKILPIWEKPKPKWITADLYGYLALLDYGENPIYLDHPNIWGANFIVKASMFRKYGGFETSIGRVPKKLYAGEETQFIRRLIDNGEKVLYIPDVVVHHLIPSNRMDKSYFCKWRFDQGELEAIVLGSYTGRNIMGIPYYAIRCFLRGLLSYLWDIITSSEDKFIQELRVIHLIGFILGRIRFKRV